MAVEVNGMGMTDLQFKGYIKQLIRSIEHAESQKEEQALRKELEQLRKDLQELLEG